MQPIRPTDAQRKFIECVDRSILLHACVGTGKTFALANRAAEAIRRGILAERILCVTFTNRAAEEMRQRIELYCPADSHKVVTRTFHSLCAWIIRQGAVKLGIPQDFCIIDEDDAQDIIDDLKLPKLVHLSASTIYYVLEAYKLYGRVVPPEEGPALQRSTVERLYALYHRELAAYKALDFSDLILLTHRAFKPNGPLADEWSTRFDLVQVDEMQDTTLMEYEVVAHLARKAQNLVLAGDFDQTIYEWRGSVPETVIDRFRQDFPRQEYMTFVENHRATETLVRAAGSVVSALSKTAPRPAKAATKGDPIMIHSAPDERSEAGWIAQEIKRLRRRGVPYKDIGVLCRSNKRARAVSGVLEAEQVPHITVEAYEFFRRQEVKDCMARLRFLLNSEDRVSARRILQRPASGVGDATMKRIEDAGKSGLRLTDLFSLSALDYGDPFELVLNAVQHSTLIVFDCETTGIDPLEDDIIELAAYKIHKGALVDTFHRYLKPRKPVGRSVYVHGITDAFLTENGEKPRDVLRDFVDFIGGGILVGHNVVFDIRMLESACSRNEIAFVRDNYADTLSLARRFMETNSYKLGDLAERLSLSHRPTHRAIDDVATTWELLKYLVPRIERGAAERRRTVQAAAHVFRPLAEQIDRWRSLMTELRPYQLLDLILEESGLFDYYRREENRLRNIDELRNTAREIDDRKLPPLQALEAFVSFAALVRNIDRIDRQDRVAVITIHQAKGLEFDVVFMPGLVHYEFPNYGAMREGRIDEETRIFYVGLTRAKQKLYMSWHATASPQKRREPSQFLRLLPRDIVVRSG
ncbi:MAG: UvrD-helicase domain-containing protein [Firmicutes bacterium]|nr:UvrD-helicase domain-containing protein [Bacillota bacterium]